ncbi:MAG: iron-containing alcohol dehydrogenase [Treponemataceae bacterium]|nr:iron-containing alcohol dehydrogenase [Treponemataceae bacterium]
MTDLVFKISQHIVLGPYTITRLLQLAKGQGARFMIIMDPVLKEVSLQEKILQPLKEKGAEYFIFDNLADGAASREIEQALVLARKGHVNGIIAAGGTKALHVGAAVSALFHEERGIYDFLDGAATEREPLPLICIPTTIRAPFVFTAAVPVIDSRNRQAALLKACRSGCQLVIWDSNLTLSLTENQTASISLEALCLAVEAFLSQKASFFSDMFAEKALALMGMALDGTKALEVTTPADALLAQAGCTASVAAALSSVGVATLLALAMNARYRISRSLVAAILFPYIIEDAGKFKSDRIEKCARLMGCLPEGVGREGAAAAFAENIRQRLAKANLPVRLKELSVSVEQLALVAEDAGQLEIMNTLPRSMTADDLFDVLKLAY